jgi:ketosteroid isomerase-like protein
MLKLKNSLVGFIFATPAILFCASTISAQNKMSAEDQVWEMEEVYWNHVKSDDIQSYLTLWHDDFVGWPGFSPEPMGKLNISDWIPALFADSTKSFDYKLKRMSVSSYGEDIVIIFYVVGFYFIDLKTGEKKQDNWHRITHTWKRYGDRWFIIGGMSADLDSPPDKK